MVRSGSEGNTGHFQTMREKREGEKLLLPRKIMGWSTAQIILAIWIDTEDVAVGLPLKKLEDLQYRLARSQPGQ